MRDCIDYRSLATRLLRGGIAPRRVRRLVAELRDHFEDLRNDALADGMTETEAASRATARLGSEQRVASEMLARPELRSWAARWPWAIYGLLPPLLRPRRPVAWLGIAMVFKWKISGLIVDL